MIEFAFYIAAVVASITTWAWLMDAPYRDARDARIAREKRGVVWVPPGGVRICTDPKVAEELVRAARCASKQPGPQRLQSPLVHYPTLQDDMDDAARKAGLE